MLKSVCSSVTLLSHALTVQDTEIRFALHDKGTFLVSGDQICNTEYRACGSINCVKQRHPLVTAKIGPIIHHISEKCKIGREYDKLLLFTHRKSHTCFPLVPKLVTLNDLERHNGRYFALFHGIRPLPRTHRRKILATPMLCNNFAEKNEYAVLFAVVHVIISVCKCSLNIILQSYTIFDESATF